MIVIVHAIFDNIEDADALVDELAEDEIAASVSIFAEVELETLH